MMEVSSSWYIARFEHAKDCHHVLVDGPWKLFDQYVVTQRWKPTFNPATTKIEKMAMWVRLPRLPVEYFSKDRKDCRVLATDVLCATQKR